MFYQLMQTLFLILLQELCPALQILQHLLQNLLQVKTIKLVTNIQLQEQELNMMGEVCHPMQLKLQEL